MTDRPENAASPLQGDRKAIFAWCMYDWANSAFTTLVVTFIYSTYFTTAIAPDEVSGTTLWSWAIGGSAVIIALLSPLSGAIADRSGRRRRYLAIALITCVTACVLLTFVKPSYEHAISLALGIFVVGNVAFEVGNVFYNSFLPVVAHPDKVGRVSGYGWGMGYAGGLVCMVLALVALVGPETPWFGIDTEEGFNYRATNLLVAGWFLVFSLPLFVFLREDHKPAGRTDLAGAFTELARTVRQVKRYGEMVKFLVARLIYNDGLVTIFAFGGIYAAGTFGMTLSEVVVFGIVLNVTAGLGAMIFGFVDDRIGGKATIQVTLVALTAATLVAVWAPSRTWLWVAGVLIGIFVGPNQSASRSLMARFVPHKHQAEFFGFFAFSGKITSFLGPLLLGAAASAFDSQRAGVATLLAFFVVGALLLTTVHERRGIEAASAH